MADRARLSPVRRIVCHDGQVSTPARSLAPAFARALAGFTRYLTLERDRSEHTVRAYTSDVADLLSYASAHERTNLEDIDLALLRDWLGEQHSAGQQSRPNGEVHHQ